MSVLLVQPGASWSVHDVFVGLAEGLRTAGVEVIEFALDCNLIIADEWLYAKFEATKGEGPRPTLAHVVYQASKDVLERALYHQVDAVLVVSGMWIHPDILVLIRRAGIPVGIVFTESPYDTPKELKIAPAANVIWTNERTSVSQFLEVQPHSYYLPHAWREGVHDQVVAGDDISAHDVVFVGTGFPERCQLLEAIDWTGIDLGLYGTWHLDDSPLKRFLHPGVIDNTKTAQLYAKAKVGLNLYRQGSAGESLNPRALELAAGGCFTVSEARAESDEVFGALVPTFTTAAEATALMHRWVHDDAGRAAVRHILPTRVASATWRTRARQVLAQMSAVLAARQAA